MSETSDRMNAPIEDRAARLPRVRVQTGPDEYMEMAVMPWSAEVPVEVRNGEIIIPPMEIESVHPVEDPEEQRETFDALGREGRIAKAKEAVCEAAKRVRTLRGKVGAIHAIGYATPWILSDELHNAIEARDAAIDALIQAQRMEAESAGWISVKDRLPEEGRSVILAYDMPGRLAVTCAELRGGAWYDLAIWLYDGYDSVEYPLYWMPLPDPPNAR